MMLQQPVDTTRWVSIKPTTSPTPAACAIRVATHVKATTTIAIVSERFQRFYAAENRQLNFSDTIHTLQPWHLRTHQHQPLGVAVVAVGTPHGRSQCPGKRPRQRQETAWALKPGLQSRRKSAPGRNPGRLQHFCVKTQ